MTTPVIGFRHCLLLGYMARHHEDLEKIFTDEQKEIFEKFHDCWSEHVSLAELIKTMKAEIAEMKKAANA